MATDTAQMLVMCPLHIIAFFEDMQAVEAYASAAESVDEEGLSMTSIAECPTGTGPTFKC